MALLNFKRKTLSEKLKKQANDKNENDLKLILKDINSASLEGEYSRVVQIKKNQAEYLQYLGLNVERIEINKYKVSW